MSKTFKQRVREYFKGIFVCLDQLLNAILGGYPDETFSSRVYRKSVAGQKIWKMLHWLVDKMFFWEDNHCYVSYKNEITGKYSPKETHKF